MRNRSVQSRTKGHMSKARRLIGSGDLELAQQEAATAISSIDKAVSKGVFHKNKGARLKSRLMRKLNSLAAASQGSEHSQEDEKQFQR